ncbi:hypothetical protein ABVT39_007342 [Epinephelus coioides]
MGSSGRRGRAGAPKIINETDRPAVRLGQSVLIRAFPPVAAGAERQAASEFNTRRRSCELEAQKDTVERRYVPRLIIRLVSFSPYMSPSSSSLSTSQLFFFWSCLALKKHITPLIQSNNDFKLTSLSLFRGLLCRAPLLLLLLRLLTQSLEFSQTLFPPPTSNCERGSVARHQ